MEPRGRRHIGSLIEIPCSPETEEEEMESDATIDEGRVATLALQLLARAEGEREPRRLQTRARCPCAKMCLPFA